MAADALGDRLARFASEWALWARGDRIVVAVSGGADSVVLLRLLHGLGLDVVAAHADHGLRGAASDADAAFVRALGDGLGVPTVAERVGVEKEKAGVQAAARAARYAFLREVAEEEGATAVATAHHAGDLAETVLMQLARGAGPTGLGGLPVSRPIAPGSAVRVVRPLLSISKRELVACAETEGWAWREDASNQTDGYRRNRVRSRVLPVLEEEFGAGLVERVAAGALEQQRFVCAVVEPAFAACAEADSRSLQVSALAALARPVRRAVLAEAMRRWAPAAVRNHAVLSDAESLVDADPGRRAGPFRRDRSVIQLEQAGAAVPAEGWAVEAGEPTETPWGTLVVERHAAPAPPSRDPDTEVVDAAVLVGGLRLRPWRAGDRLRPLGLGGSQLVSDLLNARRVPPSARARQLVLVAERGGEEAVVWVVGHRIDEAARITPATRETAGLRWTPKP